MPLEFSNIGSVMALIVLAATGFLYWLEGGAGNQSAELRLQIINENFRFSHV